MDRRIKLIWDFRGADSKPIALHHAKHLKEYADHTALSQSQTGIEELSELHTIAYLVVPEQKMKLVRDALKPHRGTVFVP